MERLTGRFDRTASRMQRSVSVEEWTLNFNKCNEGTRREGCDGLTGLNTVDLE